ncbi:MAG: energy-coupling factor transporter transmembrane protein EcfT [Peptococcaceae bacterium]|nr:energy-coupling factor transporter transmembrane protein EcfT [Peptococcaceae bacterium]
MDQLNVFHYMHKDSVIHRMDCRIKLGCMVLLSVTASFASTWADFGILAGVFAAALLGSKLPVAALLRELRFFAFLILLVFLVHSFSVPGQPVQSVPLPGLTVEGVTSGLTFAGKLLLIIILCVVLAGTTPLSLLGKAVEWFLRPVPFIPEARVATMINLVFVLIPLIFSQAGEILNAQKARCVERRKNPVKRIIFLAFPLLFQTFKKADDLALAMEARCYSEKRTKAVFKATPVDWGILIFSAAVFLAVFFVT